MVYSLASRYRFSTDHRPGLFEGTQRRRAGPLAAGHHFARLRELVFEFVLSAKEVGAGHAHAFEQQLGGVRGPAAELVQLAHQPQTGSPARDDEQCLPAVAEFLVDHRVDDVHVGDAAVADPHLVPVDDPVGAVAAGVGAQVPYVAAALGFRDRQRRELEIAWGAEAFGAPFQHLLGGRGLADGRERQRRHDDRQPDPGAAPEQLLHEHRQRQPGGVADEIAVEERTVEAALGRLLEHGPRKFLALVVVECNRPDHLLGKLVGAAGQVVLRCRRCQVESHDAPSGLDGLGRAEARLPGQSAQQTVPWAFQAAERGPAWAIGRCSTTAAAGTASCSCRASRAALSGS